MPTKLYIFMFSHMAEAGIGDVNDAQSEVEIETTVVAPHVDAALDAFRMAVPVGEVVCIVRGDMVTAVVLGDDDEYCETTSPLYHINVAFNAGPGGDGGTKTRAQLIMDEIKRSCAPRIDNYKRSTTSLFPPRKTLVDLPAEM